MAYRMTSPSQYPYRRENAKFFSQELIEYVMFDFGHIWKPVRSKRETQLRNVASFVFIPPIGRLVAYISRKYSGFVVTKSFETWKYVNSHRVSVKERLLCNEIVSLCVRHELENDDLGLFTFFAIVAEYARLATTHEQANLVVTVVDALTYCLTKKIPKGFVPTLDRMISCALSFNYPRNNVVCDYNPQTGFVTPINTDSMYTPKSEFQSPIMLEFQCSPSLYNAPLEEIVTELKNRKIHRELFRLKMMTDCATQTEIKRDHNICQIKSVVTRSEQTDLAEKIDINDNFDNPFEQAKFFVVETNDVSVQTWSSEFGMEPDRTHKEKNLQMFKRAQSASKKALDLDVVIEKLKALEKLQVGDVVPSSSRFSFRYLETEKPEDEACDYDMNLTSALQAESSIVQETDRDIKSLVSNTCSDSLTLLQGSSKKRASDKDTKGNENLDDSQFGSLDVSTDDPEHCFKREKYSFDSQIGSLDESIRTLDESQKED